MIEEKMCPQKKKGLNVKENEENESIAYAS